jgi:hypothetical protein
LRKTNNRRLAGDPTDAVKPPYCCVPYEDLKDEHRQLSRFLATESSETEVPPPCCIPYYSMDASESDLHRQLSRKYRFLGSSPLPELPPVCCVKEEDLPVD